jgi:hypothetical protein
MQRVGVVNKPITLLSWPLYFFDLLAIGAVALIVWLFRGLAPFSAGADQVSVFWCTISVVGGLGLYGVRIATYVAIARHCRMPQVAEWWITLAGFAFMAVFFAGGGFMLQGYATLHGYKYCYADAPRNPNYVFTKRALPCPTPP